MARTVETAALSDSLQLKVKTGVDENGSDVYKKVSFKNVDPQSQDLAVYDTAIAIGDVMTHPVQDINRIATTQLISAIDE